MTRSTENNTVGGIERKFGLNADCLNVMNFKVDARSSALPVSISTFLTPVVVALKNIPAKLLPSCGINCAPVSALPVAVILPFRERLAVVLFGQASIPRDLSLLACQPSRSVGFIGALQGVYFTPIVVRLMSYLKSHSLYGGVVAFFKALIPRDIRFTKRSFLTVGVMASLVVGNAQASSVCLTSVSHGGEKVLVAPALASSHCFLITHNNSPALPAYNIQVTRTVCEHSVNCWELLRAEVATTQPVKVNVNAKNTSDWTISSQATEESVEGSTTRLWSPDRTVKTHERRTRKGRYSLNYGESHRGVGLNASTLTKLNSVPYSGKYDDLSEHPVKEIIQKTLKNDAAKTLDRAAHAQFDATLLRMTSTGESTAALTDTGTPGGTATHELSLDHVKIIADTLQERNIPTYDSEHYIAIMRPTTLRPVLDLLEGIHQYTDAGWIRIMNGEKGRYEGIRFVTQTNIPSENWSIVGQPNADAAYFFGADTVTEAIACPLELRGKIPDDYGRGKGIAWYAIEQFGITHADDTSAETKAQARVIKWDSA